MKIHYIIHAPFEQLGFIEDWATANSFTLTGTHTYRNEILPSISHFDFLIIMGGPQSPREISEYPYLQDEINLIKAAIEANKHVLGFCLGAQLIAEALGAKTQGSPEKEIGMFPINLTEAGLNDPIFKHLPKQFDVMHWHYDMPGIPKNSILLASSAGCPQQAFRYSNRVYGLQFHMEFTIQSAIEMINNCAHDLSPSRFTQDANAILENDYDLLNQRMKLILDKLIEL